MAEKPKNPTTTATLLKILRKNDLFYQKPTSPVEEVKKDISTSTPKDEKTIHPTSIPRPKGRK